MKLRKRPAQPLNLVSVDKAGSAQGPSYAPAPPAPLTADEPRAPARPSPSPAAGAPAWPSDLADGDWSLGWAEPDAASIDEAPPAMAEAQASPADASPSAPATVASAPPPPPPPPPSLPPRDLGVAETSDRPPLRQALSRQAQTPPTDGGAQAEPRGPRTDRPGSTPADAAKRAGQNSGEKTSGQNTPGQKTLTQKPAQKTPTDRRGAKRPKLDRRAASTPLGLRYASPKPDLGIARYAYLAAGMGAVLWSGSFIAFMLAFQAGVAPLTYVPFQSTLLAVLTVLPAAFMILAAFAVRQGAWMAADARTARRLAEDMVLPAAQAALETTSVLEAVRREMDRAAGATRAALDEISVLRDALTQETDRLTEAAGDAQRTARIVGETLAGERDEIAQLSRELRSNAEDVAAAVNQQTQLVADASDLARSQLQEAEATLVARAADLTAATALAGATAQDAGDRLAQHTQVLDATGAALAERLRTLEQRLSEQREGLGVLVERCNDDQDELAARLETRRAQLLDTIAEARRGALELAQSSNESADSLRDLVDVAASQMRDLVNTAAAERAALSQNAADSYAVVADQARYAQDAVNSHVESARVQVEQLGQFAFDAGQRANQAFEGRIAEARRLIEQSAALVEDAGLRSAARIEVGVAASRSALEDLSQALAEVDARITKLPDEARSQAELVRAAVESAAADLAAAVRKLSLETKAVDDSFQARVRKSYEALKSYSAPAEAAKTMEPQPAPPPSLRPDVRSSDVKTVDVRGEPLTLSVSPRPPVQSPRSDPADLEALRRTLAQEDAEAGDHGAAAGLDGAGGVKATSASDLGLRRRLRLTPTEADAALKSVFDPLQNRQRDQAAPRMFAERSDDRGADRGADRAASQPSEADLEGWTWQNLLSSIDEAPATDDALASLMIEEINALGLDAGALLPRLRLDEISAAAVAMGPTAVRDTVRRLAPAAVRRLSRRVLTDKTLKDQADRYLSRYRDLLQGSLEKDPAVVNTLLGSDPGRAYLLLDAAIGDLH